jgi:hypothetical protein
MCAPEPRLRRGNEVDEYLDRVDEDDRMLGASEDEIRRGERRLAALDHNIAQCKFLKAGAAVRLFRPRVLSHGRRGRSPIAPGAGVFTPRPPVFQER